MTLPDGFSNFGGFLDLAEQETLLRQVQALSFVRDRFRGQELKRRFAQFGYEYVSTGRGLRLASVFPDFLTALVAKTMMHCPSHAEFDQCIVTHYPRGAGIGWHTDADRFGDVIIAISLAGNARLRFRANGATSHSHECIVTPGSLYIMRGSARWNYQHQVVPVKADRYSLTFRHVLEPERD